MSNAAVKKRAGRYLVFGVLAAIAVVGFVQLGRWQWHRAEEKRALQRDFAAGVHAAAADLGERPLSVLARYAHVVVRGHYEVGHQFLLDNISRDGQAGYEVLTPLQLDDGRMALVNRGWLPLPGGSRQQLPDISVHGAALEARMISARVDNFPVAGLELGHQPPALDARWPKLTSFPRANELAAALGRRVEPRQLLLDATQADGYRRDWQPASAGFGPERHLSYAVQWWSLAALVVVLYGYMSLRSDRG
jgi:surfeit locus 1 family protein